MVASTTLALFENGYGALDGTAASMAGCSALLGRVEKARCMIARRKFVCRSTEVPVQAPNSLTLTDDTMLYASRPDVGIALPPPSKRPTSPTFSDATTQASALNISGGPDVIITRAHLRTSVQTYEEVRQAYNVTMVAETYNFDNAAAKIMYCISRCSLIPIEFCGTICKLNRSMFKVKFISSLIVVARANVLTPF